MQVQWAKFSSYVNLVWLKIKSYRFNYKQFITLKAMQLLHFFIKVDVDALLFLLRNFSKFYYVILFSVVFFVIKKIKIVLDNFKYFYLYHPKKIILLGILVCCGIAWYLYLYNAKSDLVTLNEPPNTSGIFEDLTYKTVWSFFLESVLFSLGFFIFI